MTFSGSDIWHEHEHRAPCRSSGLMKLLLPSFRAICFHYALFVDSLGLGPFVFIFRLPKVGEYYFNLFNWLMDEDSALC